MQKKDGKFIFILIVLHLAIALPLAYFLNIWMDEASTLHTTEYGFLHALQNAATDEKQAPLYFYILSLWRAVNHSIFFARLFAVGCSVISIKLFYDLARRFFDENETRFITTVFAFHPALVWASLEIRVYALVILLTILLLRLFSATYLETENLSQEQLRKREILYIIFAVIALYTNYYLGFILLGNFCALVAVKRFARAKTYFLQMLVVGVCLLPMVWIIKQQFIVNTDKFQRDVSAGEDIRIIWGYLTSFIFPVGFPPLGERNILFIPRNWLARLGFLFLLSLSIKNKFSDLADRNILLFGAITFIVCLCLFGFYFFVGPGYIAPRHALPLLVPLLLFSSSVVVKMLPRRIWVAFAVIFIFLFSYSFYYQYSPLAKRGDWNRVARFIETNETPNQPIIVFRNFDALCLPYYYHGVNKILPDKNFFAWDNEDDLQSENALQNQTNFIVSQIPADSSEIWLTTEEVCQKEATKAACKPLEDFVEDNYTTVMTQDFYLERVRFLRKK